MALQQLLLLVSAGLLLSVTLAEKQWFIGAGGSTSPDSIKNVAFDSDRRWFVGKHGKGAGNALGATAAASGNDNHEPDFFFGPYQQGGFDTSAFVAKVGPRLTMTDPPLPGPEPWLPTPKPWPLPSSA